MPPTAQLTIERITAEQVALYCHVPTPGENILISVNTFIVDDPLSTQDEIRWVVQRLRYN